MLRVADLPSDPGMELCNETNRAVARFDVERAINYERALWLPDILRDAGCRIELVEGWDTRGRPPVTGDFQPFGLLNHHTGTLATQAAPHRTLGVLVNGRSDLPGPLCHISPGYDGVVRVVAAGRANHAGKARAAGGMPPGDGNAIYIGSEVESNGTQRLSPAQYDAVMRSNAAILKYLRVGTDHLNRHADTSLTGKWDLGGYTTPQIRAATAAITLGDEVTPDDVKAIKNALLTHEVAPGVTVARCLLDAHNLLVKKPWSSAEPISVASALQETYKAAKDIQARLP